MPKDLDWPEWNRKRDPELWDFYARNILEPGWPGEPTEAEYEFIRDKLSRNRRLRSKWGFDNDDKPISLETVQAVAKWGEPSDPNHNSELVRKAMKKNRGLGSRGRGKVVSTPALPTQLQLNVYTAA